MSSLPPSPSNSSSNGNNQAWSLNESASSKHPKRTNTIAIIVGVLFGTCFLCCGGGSIGLYLIYSSGAKVIAESIKQEVKDTPQAIDEFGELKSVTTNFMATGELGSANKLVFDVEGSKDSGQIIIERAPDAPIGQFGEIESATIRKYDGREIEIPIENLKSQISRKERLRKKQEKAATESDKSDTATENKSTASASATDIQKPEETDSPSSPESTPKPEQTTTPADATTAEPASNPATSANEPSGNVKESDK